MKDVIMNDVPEIPSVEQIPDSQNSQNEHEISQTYEGAPEAVSDKNSEFNTKLIKFRDFKNAFSFFFQFADSKG